MVIKITSSIKEMNEIWKANKTTQLKKHTYARWYIV